MRATGFEPVRVSPRQLECRALDHSAKHAQYLRKITILFELIAYSNVREVQTSFLLILL
jgi:hypothetical protein